MPSTTKCGWRGSILGETQWGPDQVISPFSNIVHATLCGALLKITIRSAISRRSSWRFSSIWAISLCASETICFFCAITDSLADLWSGGILEMLANAAVALSIFFLATSTLASARLKFSSKLSMTRMRSRSSCANISAVGRPCNGFNPNLAINPPPCAAFGWTVRGFPIDNSVMRPFGAIVAVITVAGCCASMSAAPSWIVASNADTCWFPWVSGQTDIIRQRPVKCNSFVKSPNAKQLWKLKKWRSGAAGLLLTFSGPILNGTFNAASSVIRGGGGGGWSDIWWKIVLINDCDIYLFILPSV